MATYIALVDFTEQGIMDIENSPKRARAFKSTMKEMGVKVKDIYWTLGTHDGVVIFDAPDEETATAAMLTLGSAGTVRTMTLRAFSASEIKEVINKARL